MDDLLALAASEGGSGTFLRALRTSWTMHVATEGAAVRGLMDGLPPELWDADPWLVCAYGATWRSVGSPSRSAALPYFDAAFAALTDDTPLPARVGIELHYSASLRSLGRLREAFEAADHAAGLVAPDTTMPLAWRIRFGAKAVLQRGIALYHLGDFDSAKTDLRTAAGLADGNLLLAERVECYAALSMLEYSLGEFELATGYVSLAREASGTTGLVESPFGAGALVAELLITIERNRVGEALALAPLVAEASARSDWEPLGYYARAAVSVISELYVEGLDLLRQCLQSWRKWDPPGFIVTVSEGLRATLLLRLGQRDLAWDILGGLEPTQHHANCPGRFIAHLRFVTGDATGTLAALADCVALGDSHSSRTLVDVQLLLAAAHYRLGNPALADLSFDRGLILAVRNGMRLPFRLVPNEDMRVMLDRASQRPQPDAVHDLIADVGDWGADSPDHGLVQLSDREREIVRSLLRGYTVSAMADELFISVNTVKSHLKSVYRKLGVGSRQAAIQRARELGLQL
ncbi:MAG: DNA-binding response regulator [Rhodoglobus sp.]|nr:DNA-binding response regulator [Rhodoglobus sp.]